MNIYVGDFINNQAAIDVVRKNLEDRHVHWRSIDGQGMSTEERNNSDSRIHCVFYFIASHRIKDIDIVFMQELSNLVNIVPVIAKADMMTVDERRDFLHVVHRVLTQVSIKSNKSVIYDFEEEFDENFMSEEDILYAEEAETNQVLKNAFAPSAYYRIGEALVNADNTNENNLTSNTKNIIHNGLPKLRNVFAIVCDNTPGGRREFPWGVIDIYDEKHSDFRRLQRLVFEEGTV